MNKGQRDDLLSRWIKPSSDKEKEQQDRAERMVRDAISAAADLRGTNLVIYTKGSYPNNTNVRRDSDVDVAVELRECRYYDYRSDLGTPTSVPGSYSGAWTPQKWRATVTHALSDYFGASQVDATGAIAINISAIAGSRPSTDIVPSYEFVRYDDLARSTSTNGSCVFPANGGTKVVNWPAQQLGNGRAKNTNTGGRYKNFVRALKNAENTLSAAGTITDLPSYLMECLVFNVDDATLTTGDLDGGFRATLVALWKSLEVAEGYEKMVEPNRMKWLFRGDQKWTVADARSLVLSTWRYFGYGE